MPGSATIGTNLVDSLLGVVDDLRGSLHPDMGVRQWRVFTRRRAWSGSVGEGLPTDTDVEILPQPLVEPDDRRLESTDAGMDEAGFVTLSEVSLTYTEAELDGGVHVPGAEWLYVLVDAHGQGIAPREYVLAEPPKPDRTETIGWVIRLKLVTKDGCQ